MSALPDIKEPEPIVNKQNEIEAYYPPLQGEWTYADYLRLPENDNRYEILEGEIIMSPAPIPRHQLALQELHLLLGNFVKENKLGVVWLSPIDVVFPGEKTVVQPDILFIAKEREAIVTETNIDGVPDLVIEIISPGSSKRDRRDKYRIYMQAGIKEYWILDPQQKTLEINVLRGESYVPLGKFKGIDQVRSEVLSGLTFTMKALF